VHVILDNGMHESTGGQRTVATGVRIPQAMRAGGYRRVLGADSVTGFALAALKEPGPTGIHIPIAPRVSIAPRIGTEPDELVRRTRNLLVHNARRQR
jgi:phosphonopyruvate decarboxylase